MKKILVFGNSQVGVYRKSYSQSSFNTTFPDIDVTFLALPRGVFSHFNIDRNRLFLRNASSLPDHLVKLLQGKEEWDLNEYSRILAVFSWNRLWLTDYFGSSVGRESLEFSPENQFVSRFMSDDLVFEIFRRPREIGVAEKVCKKLLESQEGRVIFIGAPLRGEGHKSTRFLINAIGEPQLELISRTVRLIRKFADVSVTDPQQVSFVLPPIATLTENQLATREAFMSDDQVHPDKSYGEVMWGELAALKHLFY
jgi:hypothetical protein